MAFVNLQDFAWRPLGDGALVVSRTSNRMWHLNAVGTAVWRVLIDPRAICSIHGSPLDGVLGAFLTTLRNEGLVAADATRVSLTMDGDRAVRAQPRVRRLDDLEECVAPILPAATGIARNVGNGLLWCAPDGRLALLTGDAVAVWRRVSANPPSTFVALSDALSDDHDLTNEEGEQRTTAALRELARLSAVEGLSSLKRFRDTREASHVKARAIGARTLGRLDGMDPVERRSSRITGVPPPPLLQEPRATDAPAHVAIVCQYGISGLAPGVDEYVGRCLVRLESLDPDIIVLSGGGRHGLAAEREAESVIARYRAQMPERTLWLERYSATTWQNVQNSLEMLAARAILPTRISLVGDRARTEKLHLCCRLARRRFPAFQDVIFQVEPIRRPRATWRDRRAAQIVMGTLQTIRDYRASAPTAGAVS